MKEQHPHHGPQDPERVKVESSALSPKPILLFLAVLFVATAFVFVIVGALDWGFRELDDKGPVATQIQERKLPPSPIPLLQGAPGRDSTTSKDVPTMLPLDEMKKVRDETNRTLTSYGWQDKQAGIARIPIDSAKRIIAEQGLPALPSANISEEVERAEKVRKEILSAGSNAGRMINVQPPAPQLAQQPAQQPAPQPVQPPARQSAPQPAQPQPEQGRRN